MAVSPYYLQELKSANPLSDVVSSYLPLKRQNNAMVGLCPFHKEKTPSFRVDTGKDLYHCFGCGAGGDVITFIRRMENLEYMEALIFLANRAGLPPPERSSREGEIPNARLMEVNRETARYFFAQLNQPVGTAGLDYLRRRGLSNDTIKRFGIGYAPAGWDNLKQHLREKGFSEKEQVAAGVVGQGASGHTYDVFRNRVMFPIVDVRGNIIAFGGRAMENDDRGPKYLNTGETPIFFKSRQLFALNFAKNSKQDGFVLCEGYMDVIAMHQAGFDNALATLGTALTLEQAKLLARYRDKVVLSYDSDSAGQKATERGGLLLRQAGLSVRVLSMQGAKDPDEYIQKYGADRFGLLLEGAANETEYHIVQLKKQFDLDTQEGQLGFLEGFVKLLLALENPLERDVYMGKIAGELGVDKAALRSRIDMEEKKRQNRQKKANRRLQHYTAADASGNREVDLQRTRYPKYAAAEDKVMGILLLHPDRYKAFAEVLTPALFVTDNNKVLLERLVEQLKQEGSVDLSALGEYLTIAQVERLSNLQIKAEELHLQGEMLGDYIQVLRKFAQEQAFQGAADMSTDEFGALIGRLAKDKS